MVVRTKINHSRPRLVAWSGYLLMAAAWIIIIWALAGT
jgi:hypothetical protein